MPPPLEAERQKRTVTTEKMAESAIVKCWWEQGESLDDSLYLQQHQWSEIDEDPTLLDRDEHYAYLYHAGSGPTKSDCLHPCGPVTLN